MSRKTVLLYSPHFVAPAYRSGELYRATPPLSHLALAGPLRDAGYDVEIIDAKWDVDWRSRLRDAVHRVLCVGVTSLTGPAVSDGLEFATFVKHLSPDLPVIWGGWHATFSAQQAMEDSRVDMVVRGMGERTFVEVVRALDTNSSVHDIPGIHYRDGGQIVSTPDRPLEDINRYPPPAYDLIDPKRYLLALPGGGLQASTIFSRGCPFTCDFCLDSKNRWLAVTIERMVADIEFWIGHGATRILFYDGNFFLARNRLLEFCDALLARDLPSRFRWIATAVGRRVATMDDEMLARLKQAGLMQVSLGAESGSDELLARITNKTTVDTTFEAVRRLTRHGINQHLFFMVGYPDEPADALERTLDFVAKVKTINPQVTLNFNFVTPLPGSEVFRIAVDRGHIQEPRSFEDWGRFDYSRPNLPSITTQYTRRVSRFQRFLSIAYPVSGRPRSPALVRRLAKWRIDNRYLDFPVELLIASALHFVRTVARR